MPRELTQDGFEEALRNALGLGDARSERELAFARREVFERSKRVRCLAGDYHSI
jgi:hypothetical protein